MSEPLAEFSPTAFLDLVRSYLRRESAQITWIDWLPLATTAADLPEQWTAAFQRLSDEDQYELLDRLRSKGAGPLAETLLVLLADRSTELEDPQLRLLVTEEVPEIEARHRKRIELVRGQLAVLGEAVSDRRERIAETFDLAQEELRLREALAEIRSQEFAHDERFSTVHELESQILRYETRRRILARYDEAERRRFLAELSAEVEELHQRRSALEEEISTAIGSRDTVRREVGELESELASAHEAVAQHNQRRDEAQAALAQVGTEVQRLAQEQEKFQREERELRSQREALEEHRRELQEQCRQERGRLDELRSAADSAGDRNVLAKIEELYRLLPDDRADEGFAATNRRQR